MAERRTLTCRIGGGKPFPVEWIPNETVEEFIDRMHLQANVGPACAVIDSRGWQLRETFVLRNGMALELRTSKLPHCGLPAPLHCACMTLCFCIVDSSPFSRAIELNTT